MITIILVHAGSRVVSETERYYARIHNTAKVGGLVTREYFVRKTHTAFNQRADVYPLFLEEYCDAIFHSVASIRMYAHYAYARGRAAGVLFQGSGGTGGGDG